MRFLYLFICFLLIFYANYKGLGITYDSQNYLHASKTFQEKGILRNKNNTTFNQQPPLFPVILSFFPNKENKNFVLYFNIFQIFCLISTIFIWFLCAEKILKSDIFYHLFACSLCCATPLYLVHHFVWSEPIFLLLLSADLYIFMIFLEKKTNQYLDWEMLIMIILGFLYCLQRNTGIFFIFGKIICYLIYRNPTQTLPKWEGLNPTQTLPKWESLKLQIFYGFFVSLGWVIWFLVIYFSPKEKILSHFSWNIDLWNIFFYNGKDILLAFSTYFFPLPLVEKGGIILKFFVFLILILLLLFAKKSQILGVIALIYVGFLLLFVPDYSDAERYLAVIYPIFLLVLYENLQYFFEHFYKEKHIFYRFLLFLMCIFVVYFQVYHAWRVCKNVHFFSREKK